jgi:SNF2 family DNA or RNA helicase
MREYQIEGYKWLCMLNSVDFGGILADEMGLGKTLQMIAFLLAQKNAGELTANNPALIVCPASLVYNWQTEFARFAPDMRVVAIDGTKAERRVLFADPAAEVYVCSYDIVRIDLEDFSERSLSYAVLDEAQYIKNHTTKTTRAIKRLTAKHRFALTGTPIENRLSEVWSIFDFLMPGFMGTYESFRKRYEADVIGGDEHAIARLHSLVSPFIMRRLKASVLADLPEKMDSTVYVHMPETQRKLYDASEQQLRETLNVQKKKSGSRGVRRGTAPSEKSKIEVLAEITRLRQIALDPCLVFENYKGDAAKADAILELVTQAAESGRKALVFSQFTSYLEILAEKLSKEGRDFYTITGATPKRERVRLVEAFNTDDVGVFLVSLKAGGTGLNLIGASVVIHADPWWNSAAMNQATDRAHRIGQTRDVDVYKVIAKGTIEERILDLQQRKSDLADAIISESEGIALSSLSTDDLLSLLGE